MDTNYYANQTYEAPAAAPKQTKAKKPVIYTACVLLLAAALALDGNVVQTTQALSDLLAEYEPGDTVTIAVVRDGKLVSVEIRLAENANMQQ